MACDFSQRIMTHLGAANLGEALARCEMVDFEIYDDYERGKCVCDADYRDGCTIKVGEVFLKFGRHCFEGLAPGHLVYQRFGNIPRILNACKRILHNPSAFANHYLIDYAVGRGILDPVGASYYNSLRRKIKLTAYQKEKIKFVNNYLLYSIDMSHRTAYRRLTRSCRVISMRRKRKRGEEGEQIVRQKIYEGTAGPKLARYAFSKGAITEYELNKYLRIWNSRSCNLNKDDKEFKITFDAKIVKQLQEEFRSDGQTRSTLL